MFHRSFLHARTLATALAAILTMTLALTVAESSTPATAARHGLHPSEIRTQCDAFRGAYALGTSIRVRKMTIPACGPRPAFSLLGGLLHAVLPFLSGFASYPGYQCVELSVRYLATRDGVGPPPGVMNGAQVVDSYARRFPKVYVSRANGSHHAPKRGDVISLANNKRFRGIGHTGVVIASHVNRHGNGTIRTMEQNWGGPGGARGWHVYRVHKWRVQFMLLPHIKWLHRR